MYCLQLVMHISNSSVAKCLEQCNNWDSLLQEAYYAYFFTAKCEVTALTLKFPLSTTACKMMQQPAC